MKKIIENMGSFYLGKTFDFSTQEVTEDMVYYDSKDLCTHAVCLGMTGSGKTGLCISMLEEAMLDNIPVIAIDPKGDMGNLLLNSPQFKVEDFKQWVDTGKANSKSMTADAYAKKEAQKWKEGTQAWHQSSARLKNLKNASRVKIYTPGSQDGLALSLLKSFDKPDSSSITELHGQAEHLVASLFQLMGEKQETNSPNFVYLSNVLIHLWNTQDKVSLTHLIREIQSPSQSKIGVMDIDAFISEKNRLSLAMKINALVASPSFTLWSEGESLDIKKFLWDEKGKAQTCIFSIAHLSDDERMFFVSLLLNELIYWMRKQSGTSSLRAMLYMDEIFGFLPPVENPPSKKAFLTLLKQARAYGVGLVLATQNPADLDYKALSNIGTWFLGRLQTKRDQSKVLEGLDSVLGSDEGLSKKDYQSMLSKLPSRVFIMKNIHDGGSSVFHTRWAMSYLKGPLTSQEISNLMEKEKKKVSKVQVESAHKKISVTKKEIKDIVPEFKNLKQSYVVANQIIPDDATIDYLPALGTKLTALYKNTTYQVDEEKEVRAFWKDGDSDVLLRGMHAFEFSDAPESENAHYKEASKSIHDEKKRKAWSTKFKQAMYTDMTIPIYKDPLTKLVSKSDESKREFIARVDLMQKEVRDEKVEALTLKYQAKIDAIENRLIKAEQKVEKEHSQYTQSKLSTVISFGATLAGALLGRKMSRTSIGKLGTTLRGASRMNRDKDDISLAKENVEKFEQDLKELSQKMQDDIKLLQTKLKQGTPELKEIIVRPTKSNISVEDIELFWVPTVQGKVMID